MIKSFMNSELSKMFMNKYLEARNKNMLSECYIGTKKEYRISSRESLYSDMSDPEVMLELCIYPLILQGDTLIISEVYNNINKLLNSNNPLEFFQAFEFFYGEKLLKEIHDDIPYEFFNKKFVVSLDNQIEDMKEQLLAYHDGYVGQYNDNLYLLIKKIMEMYY